MVWGFAVGQNLKWGCVNEGRSNCEMSWMSEEKYRHDVGRNWESIVSWVREWCDEMAFY